MDANEIQAMDDQLIIEDVARAVEENEFVPFVQPVFELATNKVIATETLVRWTLPEDGTVVPAGAFVPSLERTHTICGLDWCMAEAMCEFLGTTECDAAKVSAGLNISFQHVEDKNFAQRLAATADWHKVAHELVGIELSAEAIQQDERVTGNLIPSLLDAGFIVMVDNFDAGVEELRAVANMGIRVVKLAASVWRDGPAEQVRRIVDVAKELELTLAAENVENGEERAAVEEAGIPVAQGYGLAHPMSLEDFVALVEG